MLPTDAFADVVSFLAYYDLGDLKLSKKLLSAVAHQCADAIRACNFSFLAFTIYESRIRVYRFRADDDYGTSVCQLDLTSEEDVADFISEAFRNCTVGRFQLETSSDLVLSAIMGVASAVVVDELQATIELFTSMEGLVQCVDSFRRVKVCAANTDDVFVLGGSPCVNLGIII